MPNKTRNTKDTVATSIHGMDQIVKDLNHANQMIKDTVALIVSATRKKDDLAVAKAYHALHAGVTAKISTIARDLVSVQVNASVYDRICMDLLSAYNQIYPRANDQPDAAEVPTEQDDLPVDTEPEIKHTKATLAELTNVQLKAMCKDRDLGSTRGLNKTALTRMILADQRKQARAAKKDAEPTPEPRKATSKATEEPKATKTRKTTTKARTANSGASAAYTEDQLESLTRPELKAIARKIGVAHSRKSKADIIATILDA